MARAERDLDAAPTPDVAFGEGAIAFWSYPYPGASVFPRGEVRAENVAEVVTNFRPPAIRTRAGEFLVLPAGALDAARAFARAHQIPEVRRVDVWALILEPFMDATVDRGARRRMRESLRRCGLTPLRVFLLRWRLSFRVEFVHCVHFRWQHYGLADVLDSLGTAKSPRVLERFTRRANAITALGHVLGADEPDAAEPLRSGVRIAPWVAPEADPATRP